MDGDDEGPGVGAWPMVGAAALAALGLGLVGWGVVGLPAPSAPPARVVTPEAEGVTREPPVPAADAIPRILSVPPEAEDVTPEAEGVTSEAPAATGATRLAVVPEAPAEPPIAEAPVPDVLRKTDEAEAPPEPPPVADRQPPRDDTQRALPLADGTQTPPPRPPRPAFPPRPNRTGPFTDECRRLAARYALEPIDRGNRDAVAAEMRVVCARLW